MEAAKQAINKLTSSHGQHTTEVTEHYNPAITHERIDATREHRDTTVVDNEVHQDHHHTTVLPVKDREVLPTQHEHNLAAAKHTEHHHGDHKHVHDRVAAEAAQFKNKTEHGGVEKTHTVSPTIAGEHHHHHVHETIQPVIQKQTIQPSVVHTTIPVHEVHHNEPKHYTASSLPAVSMDEFKKQGGSLTGLADRVEKFEGEPETLAGKTGRVGQMSGTTGTTTSTTDTDATNNRMSNDSSMLDARTGKSTVKDGELSKAQRAIDARADGTTAGGMSLRDGEAARTETKPSLLNKLNPFKDADGDGKKGIMT